LVDGFEREANIYRDAGDDPTMSRFHALQDRLLIIEEELGGVDPSIPKRAVSAGSEYRIYSAAELDELPAQTWVAEGRIPDQGIVALIGPKGTFKTFVAIDMLCHFGLGDPWHDITTVQRDGLYVYAEGPFGARARLDAWCTYHSYATDRKVSRADLPLWILPERVPLNNPAAVATLLTSIRRLPRTPKVIVVDTLNANLDGDEDAKGMNAFVAGCQALRAATGATIIVIHHTPLGTDDRGRGHGSFDGAIDTRLIISRDAERVTLECTHQRNGEDRWTLAFETIPIAGSLALKPSVPNAGRLNGQRRDLLEVVHSEGPLASTAWLRSSDLRKSSFDKARKWLMANCYVKLEKKQYGITDAGRLALRTPSTPEVHHG
jgi:putative DNA primase/helicase